MRTEEFETEERSSQDVASRTERDKDGAEDGQREDRIAADREAVEDPAIVVGVVHYRGLTERKNADAAACGGAARAVLHVSR
jgi:hypothetical protein